MTQDTKGATIGLAPCPYCGQVWHKKSCPISVHASTSKGDGTATCTCPSGDASLRWPCPTHPNANYTSLRHYGSPNPVGEANALEAASAGELQRRLSAISVAVTGRADSSEAEVMGCIDKLTDYFTDGVCSAAQSATISAPEAGQPHSDKAAAANAVHLGEREAFEAWITAALRKTYPHMHNDSLARKLWKHGDGDYMDLHMQHGWSVWQAARADRPAAADAGDLRAQGRAEAVEILTGLCAETGIDEYIGWGRSGAPEDEGSAYWKEDKLRELFKTDDRLHNLFDRAEAMYWRAKGEKDEAERMMRMAERAPYLKRLEEFLCKQQSQEAWDLLADLKREADRPAAVGAAHLPDHVVREAVNQVRDIAIQFHAHDSLRERIAGVIVPLLKGGAA